MTLTCMLQHVSIHTMQGSQAHPSHLTSGHALTAVFPPLLCCFLQCSAQGSSHTSGRCWGKHRVRRQRVCRQAFFTGRLGVLPATSPLPTPPVLSNHPQPCLEASTCAKVRHGHARSRAGWKKRILTLRMYSIWISRAVHPPP